MDSQRGSSEAAASDAVLDLAKQDSNRSTRRGGGPKTKLGRQKSRRNAVTHGLTAKTILPEGESPEEFDAFWQGIRKDMQPVGIIQEEVIKDLAQLMWCYRRLAPAEKAEIELGQRYNPLAAEREKRYREEATQIENSIDAQALRDMRTFQETNIPVEMPRPGLIAYFGNPMIAEKCIQLLKSLRKSIQLRFFFPTGGAR